MGELSAAFGEVEPSVSSADHAVHLLTEALQPSSRAHTEWQHDPVGWAEAKLGISPDTLRWSLHGAYEQHEWDGTVDPIADMMDAVAAGDRLVGVESGTGTGKSFGIAVLCLWFLACWEDSRVYSYAPKEEQLRAFMWSEIAALWPRFKVHFPEAELTDLRIRMRARSDKWSAHGWSVQKRAGETSAVGAQGAHAQHMLLIVEEGPGVSPSIYTALQNTCSSPHNIRVAVGNPDFEDDPLHRFCLQAGARHIRASALDAPNVVRDDPDVVPGAVSTVAVEERRVLYESTPSLWESRVRGLSPKQAHGVALKQFDESRHLETWSIDQGLVAKAQGWRWYAGIDFGAWRFSFLLAAVDRAGRLHVLDEHFSGFGTTLTARAKAIVQILEEWKVAPKLLTMVGDSANQTDIIELNAAFKKLDVRYRCSGVKMSDKARATAVEKLNMLLGAGTLLFRRGLAAGLSWRLGASVASEGQPMTGSRLLWEIKRWRYPEPNPDKTQKESPDDETADGADAIAAFRYMVMTWLRKASYKKPKKKRRPSQDHDLEELRKRLREQFDEAHSDKRMLA